jgi:putative lipoprotein
MVRNTITFLFPFCLIFLLLTSCGLTGKNRKKPASTGQPYEIVLEGDTDSIVTRILTEDVPALPQPEPLCKLIQVKKGKTKGSYLLVRTRIIVNITDKDFAVKLSHDENAAPQNIIRINAHSVQQLRERLNGEKLRQIVDEAELKHLAEMISNNPSKQNKEMQEEVKKTFGLDMKIPVSMNASKKAKDFIWISNNASTGMQNLLVMKVKSEERRMKNSNAFHVNVNDKAQIDSILRTNMPGETDSMYMTIPVLLERGLWEMKGDAMGGPYVMHRIHNLYVIGFVYAPEMKKKILIKQLEAAISTIK